MSTALSPCSTSATHGDDHERHLAVRDSGLKLECGLQWFAVVLRDRHLDPGWRQRRDAFHGGSGRDQLLGSGAGLWPAAFSADSFTGTQLSSSTWTPQAGSFTVANNTATGSGTGTQLDLATVIGVNTSNVAVQATIALSNGEYAGLVADYAGSGDQNYYLGGVTATSSGYQAYLYRNSNGTFTSLLSGANPSWTGSANGVLRLEDYGGSLKLFLGSTLLVYGDDSTFTSGTVGMRVLQQVPRLSSFRPPRPCTVGTPTLPFSSDFTTATWPEPNQLTNNWVNQAGNYTVNTSTGTATGSGTGNQSRPWPRWPASTPATWLSRPRSP